ncbi:hypothetical protein BJ166DRAFT_233963 [Pestalotiopsis sp. NC0098]|nr:hypothetical protein BJ166DRAFT_233963 [Pestalotiopsis sp. NC0098]
MEWYCTVCMKWPPPFSPARPRQAATWDFRKQTNGTQANLFVPWKELQCPVPHSDKPAQRLPGRTTDRTEQTLVGRKPSIHFSILHNAASWPTNFSLLGFCRGDRLLDQTIETRQTSFLSFLFFFLFLTILQSGIVQPPQSQPSRDTKAASFAFMCRRQ